MYLKYTNFVAYLKNAKGCFLGRGPIASRSTLTVLIENIFWFGSISKKSSRIVQDHPAMWKQAWLSAPKAPAWSEVKHLIRFTPEI